MIPHPVPGPAAVAGPRAAFVKSSIATAMPAISQPRMIRIVGPIMPGNCPATTAHGIASTVPSAIPINMPAG